MENEELLVRLQARRGYQGQRISPALRRGFFVAEVYSWMGKGNAKGWRTLRDAKTGDFRLFATPRKALDALIVYQREIDELQKP